MADITDYPVLSQVTNEMASRLMVAGKNGLIMYLPEKENIPKMNDSTNIFNNWPNNDENALLTPQPPPVSPTTAMKTAKFTPIYIGHRANEKNYDLIFKVHEGILTGSIGKCFRFVVEKRPKKISGVIEGEYLSDAGAM